MQHLKLGDNEQADDYWIVAEDVEDYIALSCSGVLYRPVPLNTPGSEQLPLATASLCCNLSQLQLLTLLRMSLCSHSINYCLEVPGS